MGNLRNNSVGGNEAKETAGAVTPSQSRVVRLLGRAISGDCEAFGELYSIYLDRIYRYVFYQVRDKMTAEDITEEVFIKAWKALASCKGKERTFSSWLYRIARNQLIDSLRKRHGELPLQPEMTNGLIDRSQTEKALEQQEQLEALTYLPRNQRQVVILKFIEGFDNREISRIMSKSEGAIRVLQTRALATLRQRLGAEG